MYSDTDLMTDYDNMTQEEIQDYKYHKFDYFVNVIKFGVHPKNLDDRKIKAPLVKTIKSYKVAFGSLKGFELTDAAKISEAYLHNI